MTEAPVGKIRSAVITQAFAPETATPLLFNGTRNGSSWLWDVRADRRVYEFNVDSINRKPSSVVDKTVIMSGIVCATILSGNIHVVTQRSNGALSVLDLRKPNKPVLLFSRGFRNKYLNLLQFAMVC